MKRTVHQIAGVHHEKIAEIVEASLFRGDVGDAGAVGRSPRAGRHPLLNVGNRQSEQSIDRPHPIGVAPGQVVVERQYVHTAIGESVEHRRHHGRQRLSFTGLHLHDMSGVESQARDDLFIERTLAEDTARRFPRQRKRRDAQDVSIGAGASPVMKILTAALDLLVRELVQVLREIGDRSRCRGIVAQVEADTRALKSADALP